MNHNKISNMIAQYEEPQIEILLFSSRDIISTSGPQDENQGGWDPQTY